MIPYLLIHSNNSRRVKEVEKILLENDFSLNHPDLLIFKEDEKLGIEQAKKIQQFLSLKPYQAKGQAVVIIAAENFTLDAQNALLKTLEEPPEEAIIILGVSSEEQLLPTIISRCKTVNLSDENPQVISLKYQKDIEKLLPLDMEKRFQYIEKLDSREGFLSALTAYFRNQLLSNDVQPPRLHKKTINNFLQNLTEAEKWAKQNVNIRAILEYLMLKMPSC